MSSSEKSSLTRRQFVAGVGAAAVAGVAMAANAQQPIPGPLPDKKVRIGIVGGRFGATFQWHLDPECVVSAVCDLRDDALDRLSKVYGCTNTFKNFREMLKHPELDAVGVFTPAPLHVWMATEAMKAGKHVVSAVPAGMTQAELEQLLDCVKATGMNYMMAETSYYRPDLVTCREKARAGEFGTIFYSEAEYHHEGLIPLMYDEHGLPTWRHGFPPMHYPTHSTGMVVPVTGERLTEVTAIGWGDNHEVLQTNEYENPFWNTTGFFKTSGGHSSRISVFWHVAAGGTERASFYGDRMSYAVQRPEGLPNTIMRITKDGQTVLDANGYPEGEVHIETDQTPNYMDRLPEPMRVETGHGNSHTFLTHEFVRSIVESRAPAVDVYEAIAYTLPGIVAHQSALRGGERMKIPSYDPPARAARAAGVAPAAMGVAAAVQPASKTPQVFIKPKDYRRDPFKRMVILGESTVEGGPWLADPSDRYADVLAKLVEWSQGAPLEYHNKGIGANAISTRSPGYADSRKPSAMERYQQDVIALEPDLFLLCYGLNDMRAAMPVQDFHDDMATILRDVKAASNPVTVLTTVYYMTGWKSYPPYDKGSVELTLAYNDCIRGLAAEFDCIVADVWAAEGGADWLIDPDGVHANRTGNRVIAHRIFEALAQHASCLGSKSLEELKDTEWRKNTTKARADAVDPFVKTW